MSNKFPLFDKNQKARIVLGALMSGSIVELESGGEKHQYRYFSKGDEFDVDDETFQVTEAGLFMLGTYNDHRCWIHVFNQEFSHIVDFANAQSDESIVALLGGMALQRMKNFKV